MLHFGRLQQIILFVATCFVSSTLFAAETFRVATYNVENYLDVGNEMRRPKSPEAKTKVRDSILALQPDVIALQEMGTTNALLELQASLKAGGLDLPFWEHIAGRDTNIHVAILSKFPFCARHPYTNDHFLLSGRRFQVSRGFAEVEIQVNANYKFTLITAHLKSRRPIPEADESEMRQEEAKLLREKIDAHLAADPKINLVVLGDLNDIKDSPSTKMVIGHGKTGLFDTRPAERNGDPSEKINSRSAPRNITWTHFYGVEDNYSRIDYILLSHAMQKEWQPEQTYILASPNWGVGSDHRPIIAGFVAEER